MKLTNKEAIANLNHIYGIVSPDIQRSLDVAIKALEERPQGDLISRDALKEDLFIKFGNQLPNGLLDEIDNAPTVERPQGECQNYIHKYKCDFYNENHDNCKSCGMRGEKK